MSTHSTRPLLCAAILFASSCGTSTESRRGGDAAVLSEAGSDAASALRIRVIDQNDRAPIAQAKVRVGEQTLTTNEDGIALWPGRSSAPRIDVLAAGHVPATWIGVPGADLTVALAPRKGEHTQAKLAGSLVGLSDLPVPAAGHRLEIEVRHSFPLDLAGVQAGLSIAERERALCTADDPSELTSCAFELTTQAGAQRIYAFVFDVDSKGTSSPADDTRSAVALAVSDLLSVSADEVKGGIRLTSVAADQLREAPLNVRGPDAAAAEVVGVPGVKMLDGSGVMLFPLSAGAVLLPARAGVVGDAKYWVLAESKYYTREDDEVRTRIVRREIEPDDLTIDAWPRPPGRVTLRGDSLALVPAPDAELHTLRLTDTTGRALLDALIVKGDHFALPKEVESSAVAVVELAALTGPFVLEPFDLTEIRLSLTAEIVRTIHL